MVGKIDVYIRSIERFGAAGAVLASGQAVTLRFPTGDRQATQVTPHDQLVVLVREVAPPAALNQIDNNRPARFELDSGAVRYQISVAPNPGAWQVLIEPATLGSGSHSGATFHPPTPTPPPPHGSSPKRTPGPTAGFAVAQPPVSHQPLASADDSEMYIERGQYEARGAETSSGSALLDLLTQQARAAGASDVYLAAGSAAYMRVSGQLTATSARSTIDADLLARELGIVAPPGTREQWHERGTAMFTYGDGLGRVRVTLTRDHRGPGASLRLLVGDPPTLEQLGLSEVEHWLESGGLVLIGGRSGVGKTTTLAAMVRWLGENRRRVVTIEDPIEIVHVSPWVSQRAVREHVPSLRAGVEAAMQEGA
ncbi:MAG: ATPase, T2SS/T4P/T4SS family, partial [Proteobacteria bacterium]|nr:ATPase, T2SS/T4P/T4SS family [Pseudomonadota bacterium]